MLSKKKGTRLLLFRQVRLCSLVFIKSANKKNMLEVHLNGLVHKKALS